MTDSSAGSSLLQLHSCEILPAKNGMRPTSITSGRGTSPGRWGGLRVLIHKTLEPQQVIHRVGMDMLIVVTIL
jgi:hypothetical protein